MLDVDDGSNQGRTVILLIELLIVSIWIERALLMRSQVTWSSALFGGSVILPCCSSTIHTIISILQYTRSSLLKSPIVSNMAYATCYACLFMLHSSATTASCATSIKVSCDAYFVERHVNYPYSKKTTSRHVC